MSNAADDFDALFDEVSAQRVEPVSAPVPTAGVEQPLLHVVDNDRVQDGDDAQVPADSLTNKPMYDRLGGIVRQLHDSLRELGYDRSLADVVTQVTDASDRLEYIATLTEQAANKVLNSIDEAMPVQDALVKQAKDVDARWTALFDGKLGIEEFKTLATDSRQFAGAVVESGEAEKARLMEIMMAQDFQDITGQIIKKVVAITQKLEQELAQLLRDNAPATTVIKEKPVDLMAGPSAPASAMAQDDVDDLLADLGF
jgi:chemotaxis protein CheZ